MGVEKYSDLPFFYGRSQSTGSNANGVFVCSLGIIMMSHSFLQTIILILIFAPIISIERCVIESKRRKKEEKFLWQQGIASEDFKYKGKGLFSNGVKKVYSKDGIIKKGEPIMVVAIDGFDLIIKKAKIAK